MEIHVFFPCFRYSIYHTRDASLMPTARPTTSTCAGIVAGGGGVNSEHAGPPRPGFQRVNDWGEGGVLGGSLCPDHLLPSLLEVGRE